MAVASPRRGTPTPRYISGVRIDHDNEAQHRQEIAEKVNQLVGIHNEVVYDDYIISGLSLAKGASAPDLAELRDGLYMNAFAGTGVTVEQGFFSLHILHGIKAGTTPTFHIHWTHNQASPTGNVKWMIDYSMAKGYGVSTFPAPTTLSTTRPALAQYIHDISDDDDMPLSSIAELEPDSLLLCRIYRDPADGADTFGNDAFLVQVDMHYQRDKLGTVERNRPFSNFV